MHPSSPAGLYLHVPFCRSKCPYCGFFSVVRADLEQPWLQALTREAAARAPAWGTFDTCYVGGGTPSALSDATLAKVVRMVARTLRLETGAERTLEVNPADVTPARARLWRGLGFDRVSVGVQSFRDDELRWLRRRHDARTAAAALEALQAAGFDRLGIDLVLGLPGQTLAARLESVARALAFEPDHLSCYELTVEEGTPLASEVAAGRCELPAEDEAAAAFVAVSERLRERGFVHYEISNFARGRRAASRHNRKYWDHTPYLGLGPAAHSFAQGERWSNMRSVEGYTAALTAGRHAVAHRERLSDEQLRWERVCLGLRTDRGISLADVSDERAADTIAELENGGLVRRREGRLLPTLQGYLVADALARRLLFGDAVRRS